MAVQCKTYKQTGRKTAVVLPAGCPSNVEVMQQRLAGQKVEVPAIIIILGAGKRGWRRS